MRAWQYEGWPVQLAFYKRAFEVLTGERPDAVILAQETYPPYLLSITSISPRWEAYAEHRRERAVRIFGECLASGEWPGYGVGVQQLEMPAWYAKQAELEMQNREQTLADVEALWQ